MRAAARWKVGDLGFGTLGLHTPAGRAGVVSDDQPDAADARVVAQMLQGYRRHGYLVQIRPALNTMAGLLGGLVSAHRARLHVDLPGNGFPDCNGRRRGVNDVRLSAISHQLPVISYQLSVTCRHSPVIRTDHLM